MGTFQLSEMLIRLADQASISVQVKTKTECQESTHLLEFVFSVHFPIEL